MYRIWNSWRVVYPPLSSIKTVFMYCFNRVKCSNNYSLEKQKVINKKVNVQNRHKHVGDWLGFAQSISRIDYIICIYSKCEETLLKMGSALRIVYGLNNSSCFKIIANLNGRFFRKENVNDTQFLILLQHNERN